MIIWLAGWNLSSPFSAATGLVFRGSNRLDPSGNKTGFWEVDTERA